MGHLTLEELLDIAEGSRRDDVPHLASCEACRRHVSSVRAALASAAAVEVPEPSPLFWDHLSARVRSAVEAEGRGGSSSRWLPWPVWRLVLPVGAVVAALGVALAVGLRSGASDSGAVAEAVAESVPPVEELLGRDAVATDSNDNPVDLMGGLAGDWDWEFTDEAGLTARDGAVESLVQELSDEERVELRRLLEEELSSRSGV